VSPNLHAEQEDIHYLEEIREKYGDLINKFFTKYKSMETGK